MFTGERRVSSPFTIQLVVSNEWHNSKEAALSLAINFASHLQQDTSHHIESHPFNP